MGKYDENMMMGKYDENMMMGKYDDDLTTDHCLPSVAELMVTGFGKGKGEAQIETYKLKKPTD